MVGCAEEDIADDTSKHALRTRQLLLRQMERNIECQRHEAQMRVTLLTYEAAEERQELRTWS